LQAHEARAALPAGAPEFCGQGIGSVAPPLQ